MTVPAPELLLELAVDAATRAGALLLDRFRGPAAGVGSKSTPTDLVSAADLEAEARILDVVRAARPNDAILAEEGGAGAGTTGLRWVIDPLDGTVNFLFGIPQWSVSVAVQDEAGALAAVVHDPCRAETFTAMRGDGARLDGERVTVADVPDLAEALVVTGFSYDADVRASQASTLAGLLGRVRDIRRLGSAALDLAWTACGRVHGFYEAPLGEWDMAAGRLLVTEAGGRCTDLASVLGPGIVASGPEVHDALVGAVGPADVRG